MLHTDPDRQLPWLNQLPGFVRSAPGLERAIWRKLPAILLLGTLLPLAGVALAVWGSAEMVSSSAGRDLQQWAYLMLGVLFVHWTLVLTLAIGCVIVMLMKGPAYVADGYALVERDAPTGPGRPDNALPGRGRA